MAARDAIKEKFGEKYLPSSPRMYKNKAKNAQEAHECIRPTDMFMSPEKVKISDADQQKLYDLIYKRTIASQMAAAQMERTTVDISSSDGQVILRATGQVVLFEGFIAVYEEGRDDSVVDDDDKRLPLLAAGDKTDKKEVLPEQHFTQPPPRYTEATLVKKMEELGIGRPSTYASIVTTIQDRDYVTKDKGRLIPQDKGRLVTVFLSNYFKKYVEYDFTASLENELDEVSAGEVDYHDLLKRFWKDFSAAIAETAELRITEVLDKINEVLEPHLFPAKEDGSDPRACPNCGAGRLSMRTARSGGAFIGCSNYPECRFTRPFGPPGMEQTGIGPDGKLLGHDDGDPISLRDGRYGPYVQRGEASEDFPKPPRASLPKGWTTDSIDLDKALMLLNLPREIGPHPEDGVVVEAGIGRFGPFVKHGTTYANLKEVDEVFDIGMNRAVEVLALKKAGRGGREAAKPLKELGDHPDGGAMAVMSGRYGPYIKWEKVNATLPKDVDPETVTVEQAIELVNDKAAKSGKKRKAPAKKPAAKKATAKKAPAKKAASDE